MAERKIRKHDKNMEGVYIVLVCFGVKIRRRTVISKENEEN